jgi:hypothetical protein
MKDNSKHKGNAREAYTREIYMEEQFGPINWVTKRVGIGKGPWLVGNTPIIIVYEEDTLTLVPLREQMTKATAPQVVSLKFIDHFVDTYNNSYIPGSDDDDATGNPEQEIA